MTDTLDACPCDPAGLPLIDIGALTAGDAGETPHYPPVTVEQHHREMYRRTYG